MLVLIVDDSKAMRALLRRGLRQAGFGGLTVAEAADGAEAFELIRAERPDLVLSDWNMPNMTGIELLEAVRGRGSLIPFGFVTSNATPVVRQRAIEAGAAFLIAKPFTADVLQAAIEAVVNGSSVPSFNQVEVSRGAAGRKLPTPEGVSAVLRGLTNQKVSAVEWRTGPDPKAVAAAGVYRAGERVVGTCVLDIGLAAAAVGALVMLPAGSVAGMVKTGKLEDSQREVAGEVLNVLSRLFSTDDGTQPMLAEWSVAPAPAPTSVTSAGSDGTALHLAVKVEGYGPGKLSVVLAA